MNQGLDTQNRTVYVASRVVVDAGRTFAPGAIVVSNGIVLLAGPKTAVLRALPASFAVRELPGAAILPGLVNAHTHLQIPRNLDGNGQPFRKQASFTDWLLQMIAWRLQADPSKFADIFRSTAGEALSFGTTAVGEIAGSDISLYASCPLRARVFAEGIGFSPESAPVLHEVVREAVLRLEGISVVNPLVVPGVSPHTLYTVGEELLRQLGALAAAKKIPACLHLAESPAEADFLENGGGEIATRLYPAVGQDVSGFRGIGRPIPAYLADAGLLRDGLLLAHNVHLSTETIDALRRGGARFVLCPRSNQAHGNGIPHVTHFVDAGIPFALGTDSLGSVDDLNLWEEIRCARSLYKGKMTDADLCRELMLAVTVHGAAALSLPAGSLNHGASADFVVVDDPGGEGNGFCRNLIERIEPSNVRMTVVAGRVAYGEGA
jgi:aminodeoxyfutalosine deaminase